MNGFGGGDIWGEEEAIAVYPLDMTLTLFLEIVGFIGYLVVPGVQLSFSNRMGMLIPLDTRKRSEILERLRERTGKPITTFSLGNMIRYGRG